MIALPRLFGFSAIVVAAVLFAFWLARLLAMSRIGEQADSLLRDGGGDRFDPASVAALPDPARRFLLHALATGTRLPASVRLTIEGSMRLKPDGPWLPMASEQVSAPPHGMVWQATVGRWPMRILGYDAAESGEAQMRWWLWGIVPVVRASGPDIVKSAAGRVAGEAVWIPSRLLPPTGVEWTAVDDGRAIAKVKVFGEVTAITLSVDAEGRLERVELPRWDTNGPGPPRWSTFVVEMSGERTWSGVTIGSRGRAGWRLGEPDEFEFFRFDITEARFR